MSIEMIEGVIEAIGQNTLNGSQTNYSYIRILNKKGNVQTVKEVVVYNAVDSYLNAGLKCKLFLAKYRKGGVLLFAISTDSRNVYDHKEIKDSITAVAKMKKIFLMCIIISVPLMIAIVGLVLFPVAVYGYFILNKAKLTVSQNDLNQYLVKNGFSI